jgi:hypothetical protein
MDYKLANADPLVEYHAAKWQSMGNAAEIGQNATTLNENRMQNLFVSCMKASIYPFLSQSMPTPRTPVIFPSKSDSLERRKQDVSMVRKISAARSKSYWW